MKKLTTSVLAIVLSSSFAMLSAQEKKNDSTKVKTKEIDAVRIVGYRKTTKRTSVTSVASVDSDKLENKANSNVLNAVQGKVAGVNISASSGQPGSTPNVIIRGVGTVNGNTDPLYVIDGFPSNSDGFKNLNANDIKTFDVLKDAAAISEYGSRGSNGVILITTKTGSYRNKTSYRYNTTTGVAMLQGNSYNHANTQELLTLEKRKGAGLGVSLTDEQIKNYSVNTDWRKVFFRPAFTQSHDFSVTAGSKNINSYTSIGYLNQEGLLKTTGMKRFTLRNNINGRSKNRKFKYALRTAAAYSKNNYSSSVGGSGINRNYLLGAYQSVPYISPDMYTSGQGVVDLYSNGSLPGFAYTPLMLIDKFHNFKQHNNQFRLDLVSDVSYEFLKGLEGRVRTSGQYLISNGLTSEYPWSFNALVFQGTKKFGGQETVSTRKEFMFNNLWQLSYTKKLKENTFTLTGNAEYNLSQLNNEGFTQRGLDPKVFVPGAGTGYASDNSDNDDFVPSITNYKLKFGMISYFGSFEYDFDKKFGLVATLRTDGSSRFAEGKKWGTFWSVGARYNLDRESFIKDNAKWINQLKVRGSYGTVGNQRVVNGTVYAGINPPKYADIYQVSNNVYNDEQGYGISFGDADLRWETTEQYNVGADFRFFKRLSGSFDYYNKKTIDLFLQQPTSPGFGTTGITKNSDADVVNKGFELGLNYDVIKKRDLKFSVYANGSINIQEVSGISNGEIQNGNYITKNGGLVNEFYVYKYAGVNQSNGNLLFYDKDGNTTETPVDEDRVALGYNYLPKYQGGFGFNLEYKGFGLSTDFTFVAKVKRFDANLDGLYDPTQLSTFNVSADLLNAWTPDNTNTNIPSLTADNLGLASSSDRFLRDASYIRLRNVQLGYSLPKSLLENTFIKKVSLNLQAENLVNFTKWRGFDPESSRAQDYNNYPTPKIFSAGVDVKF